MALWYWHETLQAMHARKRKGDHEYGESMAGLLNVGEMGALALHLLVELSVLREHDPDARLTVQEMAEKLHASAHTLQKVARRLIMMELVEGTRGVKGGLRLVANPEKVTMLSVIEGMEGRLCSNGCMFAKRVCPPEGKCVFAKLTNEMEQKVRSYFEDTTIAHLREIALQPA